MNDVADPMLHYANLLEKRRLGLADEPGWLSELRAQAESSVKRLGFPDKRHEAWRYTALGPLLGVPFADADPVDAVQLSDIEELFIPDLSVWRLVLVNGRYAPHLSDLQGLPRGVLVGGIEAQVAADDGWLAEQLSDPVDPDDQVFSGLNLAGMHDGAVLHVGAGIKLERPIEILHVSVGLDMPAVAQPRNIVRVDEGGRLDLIERYTAIGESLYFNNIVTNVVVDVDASMFHFRLQEESRSAFHIHGLDLRLERGSEYQALRLDLGASWSRADWRVRFVGSQAQCHLKGLYLVGDGQLTDNHVDVNHAVPDCTSTEEFRGVLNGRGRAVFDGRILVAKDAQKTDAHLSNDNLMLSRQAEVDTKPQLEIYADDVACSHGTTVGQIQPEMLFYLRSRGIPESQAQRMICMGFAADIFADCEIPALLRYMDRQVKDRLDVETGQ